MSKKKWLIGASTCFLVLGLAACSSGESEKASGNEKHSAESSEKKSDDKELNVDAKFDKEKTDKFYNTVTKKLVKTANVDDLAITVDSPQVVPDDELSKNKNGQLIKMNITIENKGKKNHKISELLHFNIQKGDTQYFATVVSGATENHLNGNISPGEKQSGIATFDIPKEGDFKFEFSGFSKDRGIWTFTQEDIQPAQ